MTTVVGVIGVGNMGSGLVKGWLRASSARSVQGEGSDSAQGIVPDLIIWDRVETAVQSLLADAAKYGCDSTYPGGPLVAATSLEALAEVADVIIVVVKPKDAQGVLGSLGQLVHEGQTVVSAMAGLKLESLRAALGSEASLYRIMPNLGVEVGAGVVVMATEPGVAGEESERVLALFRPLGMAETIPEELFDAVTAVSGSGPAFLALAMESLEDGAVAGGLSRSEARGLVREAALRIAEELVEGGEAPAEMWKRLVSEGGMDPEVAAFLEEREVSPAFKQAVDAAMERSRQMGKS